MNSNEQRLIEALRPFAIIASYIPEAEIKESPAFAIDDDHPDVQLRTSDFKHALDTIVALDPAFGNIKARKFGLLEKTLGHPKWGWLGYTCIGLIGGIVSARADQWSHALTQILRSLTS